MTDKKPTLGLIVRCHYCGGQLQWMSTGLMDAPPCCVELTVKPCRCSVQELSEAITKALEDCELKVKEFPDV